MNQEDPQSGAGSAEREPLFKEGEYEKVYILVANAIEALKDLSPEQMKLLAEQIIAPEMDVLRKLVESKEI